MPDNNAHASVKPSTHSRAEITDVIEENPAITETVETVETLSHEEAIDNTLNIYWSALTQNSAFKDLVPYVSSYFYNEYYNGNFCGDYYDIEMGFGIKSDKYVSFYGSYNDCGFTLNHELQNINLRELDENETVELIDNYEYSSSIADNPYFESTEITTFYEVTYDVLLHNNESDILLEDEHSILVLENGVWKLWRITTG